MFYRSIGSGLCKSQNQMTRTWGQKIPDQEDEVILEFKDQGHCDPHCDTATARIDTQYQ